MTASGREGRQLAVGVIADDVTGGSDVAVAFHRRGLRTELHFSVPPEDYDPAGCDAVVIALKIRTVPRDDAESQAAQAARRLQALGAQTLFYKYCSTFDSTAEGNIGPVLDRLAALTGARLVATTPSSPEHGRTQYRGHLFVGDDLLSESHMRHHPLTPMTDASLVRLLKSQTSAPVGLVRVEEVRAGVDAVAADLGRLGSGYALIDAITAHDLAVIGAAVLGAPLVAGAAGLAGGLADAIAASRDLDAQAPTPPSLGTRAVVLAGSCSRRTLEQIEVARDAGLPHHRLDLTQLSTPEALAEAALDWFLEQPRETAPVIYSSLPPDELRAVQRARGVQESAAALEDAMRLIAAALADHGIQTFIVAGGETSGAVVEALEVSRGVIGEEAAPGVPWLHTESGLYLLLKSGNFGDPGLFVDAIHERRVEATR